MKQKDKIEEFDFGFSFADEDFEAVKETQTKLEKENISTKEQIDDLYERVGLLYETIVPFLDNLSKNPEKSTIHWPNRAEKIKDFKERLKNIAEGKYE